ncbi:MAG TPA: NUDIX hydrolase [Anaerolineales bacterium]
MTRAQCIVHRGRHILMALHRMNGEEWWCLFGGGAGPAETASQAALSELFEECCVTGEIIRQTAAYTYDQGIENVTFLVDIGNQTPQRGNDPEFSLEDQILTDIGWLDLSEISERDRAYLWAAGLLCVPPFLEEVSSWGDVMSYPISQTKV